MTGPIWVAADNGSPTSTRATSAATRSTTSSYTPPWTSRRVGSTQPCPLPTTMPSRTAVAAAASRSASSNTSSADFPPSSSNTGVRLAAALVITRTPVAPLPVKLILSIPAWPTSAAPVSESPGTTLSTPGGSPASSAHSANRSATNGASSEGLSTTQHPAASAGATFCPIEVSGPFHGISTATTPTGSRRV